MKIIIADDEILARDLLRHLLADIEDVEVVGEATDGDELMMLVRETGADLILTDIDMPGVDGLKAAFALTYLGGPDVVFVTAHERHATAAFDMDAVDYVLKPVRRRRLEQALERARRRHQARVALKTLEVPQVADGSTTSDVAPSPVKDCLWVSVRHGLVRVDLSDIQRVEAAGDHLYLHGAHKTWLHRMTMTEFERIAAGTELRRIHRSAFVRLSLIRSIERRGRNWTAILEDGAETPIGPHYRDDLALFRRLPAVST